jgi:hypothetical protein
MTRGAAVAGLTALVTLVACNDLGESPTTYTSAGDGLFTGDIDGDGDFDLLTGGGDGYGVLINDGTGHFATSFVLGHSDFSHMVLTDVNSDRKYDMVNLIYNPGDPGNGVPADWRLTTFLSNGDGTFGTPTIVGTTPAVAGNYGAISVLAADIDGDSDTDIELYKASETQKGQEVVFRSSGANSFSAPVITTTTNSTLRTYGMLGYTGQAVADMNGDGKRDVIVSGGGAWPGDEFDRGQIAVLTGNGVGGFSTTAALYPTIADTSSRAIGPVVADFNNDNRLDVASADIRFVSGPETFTFWFGQANGTLASAVSRAGRGEMETRIASGDVSGDGYPDIVTNAHLHSDETKGAGWLIKVNAAGQIAGTSQVGSSGGYDGQHGGIVCRDLDGDGKVDVALNDGKSTVTVFLNRLF